jgi:hypothetical protein
MTSRVWSTPPEMVDAPVGIQKVGAAGPEAAPDWAADGAPDWALDWAPDWARTASAEAFEAAWLMIWEVIDMVFVSS